MPRIKSTPMHLSVRMAQRSAELAEKASKRRIKWQTIRSAFQVRPIPMNRNHQALTFVVNGIQKLVTDIEVANTPEAFNAIAKRAEGTLWEVANRCLFKDPMAILFLTDIASYSKIASSLLVKQVVMDEDWCFWRDQAKECALAFQRAMF